LLYKSLSCNVSKAIFLKVNILQNRFVYDKIIQTSENEGVYMKNKIRAEFKQKRREMTKDEVFEKSKVASEYFMESSLYKSADVLMLYMPLYNETDTSYIINSAYNDGKKIVFPVTDEKSGEITAFEAENGTSFKKGAFSVNEPIDSVKVQEEEIDTVIVPGIAFTKKGGRVGFGKGCYDRFLKKCNAVKIGFCYEKQICEEFTQDTHDIKMDFLITEKGIIKCKGE